MQRFDDSVFFITGGGKGIGQALAVAAGAVGARMVIVGTTLSALEETAHLIRDDQRVVIRKLDVSDHDAVGEAIRHTVQTFGRVDCAFNNAAYYGPVTNIHEFPEAEFQRVISVNVLGVMWCMKHQIVRMLEQKSGAIVNVASAGIRSIKGNSPAYVTSKSAVVGLTRAAALTYAGKNIRINSLSPGATRTPMLESFTDDQIEALAESIPVGRCGEPDEMAAAALWLFSDEARYANGSDLLIDGGWALS